MAPQTAGMGPKAQAKAFLKRLVLPQTWGWFARPSKLMSQWPRCSRRHRDGPVNSASRSSSSWVLPELLKLGAPGDAGMVPFRVSSCRDLEPVLPQTQGGSYNGV